MDSENYRNLVNLDRKGLYAEKIKMIRDFDPKKENGEVPDPYYGGLKGFENVFQILDRSCDVLLDKLKDSIRK